MIIKETGGPKCGECFYFIPYNDVANGLLSAPGNKGRMGRCSNYEFETIKITFEKATPNEAAMINCDIPLAEQIVRGKRICFELKELSRN